MSGLPVDADELSVKATATGPSSEAERPFNGPYEGAELAHIAFPLGGLGAGMICLEGTGALSKISLRHRPELARERKIFAALSIQGEHGNARVLEGPVPRWKLRPQFNGERGPIQNECWGLPRFRRASFHARFPFATVRLEDQSMPLAVELTGWSPFSPGDTDNASLPVAALEYRLLNRSSAPVNAVFSFNTENVVAIPADSFRNEMPGMGSQCIRATVGGLIFCAPGSDSRPWEEGYCAVWLDESDVKHQLWFDGMPEDQIRMLWNAVASGFVDARAPDRQSTSSLGASIFTPVRLAPGETRTVTVRFAWYVPKSDLFEPHAIVRNGKSEPAPPNEITYQPWYATRFGNIHALKSYWDEKYHALREAAEQFTRTFYDSTLPPEALEAIAANLTILKSPTVLRQADGRLWAWEGSYDDAGSCYGSANHVWNYAQAIPHLFPDLERGLRETGLGPNSAADGLELIRVALPIRSIGNARRDGFDCPAAADGQFGEIIKVFREWRISGDTMWLRRLWPKVSACLDYGIRTWDPHRRGWIERSHLNTFDVEFCGPDSFCTSVYVGALQAATLMGTALGKSVHDYSELLSKGTQRLVNDLFDGEYFFQRTDSAERADGFPVQDDDPSASVYREHPDMVRLALAQGPLYQYGRGCLSDGLLGAWLCLVCGAGELLPEAKVESHLLSVYRHNFKSSLANHADSGRAFLACGEEGGLLLCTWPKGDRPPLVFFHADEVWTGTEYQVASHLISLGHVEEGLNVIRACRRRYDGTIRNPFSEVEEGHWYARAMSSYALLQAFGGARYDAVEKTLYLHPALKGDFRSFLATATGYGTVGVKNGDPFLDVISGAIPYDRIAYTRA